MEDLRKKLIDSLVIAEKDYQTADHLVSVTYPVIKDARLFLRALEKLSKALKEIISLILKIEHLYKRITLSDNTSKNLEIFFSKCSVKYGMGAEDCQILRKIFALERKHNESGFEFSKSGKIVIIDDNLSISYLDYDLMRKFLEPAGRLLKNTNINFKGIF